VSAQRWQRRRPPVAGRNRSRCFRIVGRRVTAVVTASRTLCCLQDHPASEAAHLASAPDRSPHIARPPQSLIDVVGSVSATGSEAGNVSISPSSNSRSSMASFADNFLAAGFFVAVLTDLRTATFLAVFAVLAFVFLDFFV